MQSFQFSLTIPLNQLNQALILEEEESLRLVEEIDSIIEATCESNNVEFLKIMLRELAESNRKDSLYILTLINTLVCLHPPTPN